MPQLIASLNASGAMFLIFLIIAYGLLIELAGVRSGRVAISSDLFFLIICCSIYLKATLRSTKESLL